MDRQVLITGASGLLGKALVRRFLKEGFVVYAQYHKNLPEDRDLNTENCQWLRADFSSFDGIRDFLVENSLRFKRCRCLINNYGPITDKAVTNLTADDFLSDFYHNVIPAFEITDFFIKHTDLESVVNIGFGDIGRVKPYKRILTYAAAKNALQLMTESFAARYSSLRFHMVSPTTLTGAAVKFKKGEHVSPESVAGEVFEVIAKEMPGRGEKS